MACFSMMFSHESTKFLQHLISLRFKSKTSTEVFASFVIMNLLIADKGRGEVIIVCSCHLAKDVLSKSKICILKIENVLSMTYRKNMLLILKDADNLQAISLDLQKITKKTKRFYS